ncbi:DUF2560 family protein [Salmonella enterica]
MGVDHYCTVRDTNSDITTRTIEAVRKSKEALDLFTTGA